MKLMQSKDLVLDGFVTGTSAALKDIKKILTKNIIKFLMMLCFHQVDLCRISL